MKIIKFLTSKAGKWSLSAMQAVGLSAAVGVAGIAAWQMMGSSAQPNLNTVFSSNTADQDVVFVAGAAGGVYGSGSYGTGGELRSGINATLSKDLQLMQADAQAGDLSSQPAFVQQEQEISAYKMDGASSGLGMAGNMAKENSGAMSGDMSAVQKQIADIQATIASQKQAAEAAAAAEGASGNAAKMAAAMKGKGGQFGMAEGMARASGNNLNSTPLQSGQYGKEGQGVSSSGVLGGAQTAGGASATGPAGQGSNFERSRASVIGQGSRLGSEASLAALQKQSADIARHSNRSANEGARAFMASTKLSGGIQLEGGEKLAGGNASSSDFADDAISALGSAVGGAVGEVTTYEEDREAIRIKIRDFAKSCTTWSYTSPGIAVLGYAFKAKKKKELIGEIDSFKEKWHDSTYEETNTIGGYSAVARDAVEDIFNAIWWFGQPKKKAREWGRIYWGDENAFWTNDTPSTPVTDQQEKPTNPYGNSYDRRGGGLLQDTSSNRNNSGSRGGRGGGGSRGSRR